MSHHSPGDSVTVRLRYPDLPGLLGRITSAIGDEDGLIGAVDVVDTRITGLFAMSPSAPPTWNTANASFQRYAHCPMSIFSTCQTGCF